MCIFLDNHFFGIKSSPIFQCSTLNDAKDDIFVRQYTLLLLLNFFEYTFLIIVLLIDLHSPPHESQRSTDTLITGFNILPHFKSCQMDYICYINKLLIR